MASTIVPNPQQEPMIQSIADQLRASTITPNLKPKTFPSASADIFAQCFTYRF